MYAIVEQGGKQYKVAEGDRLDIELTAPAEDGRTVAFDKVLLINDGQSVRVGTPYLEGARVVADLGDQPEQALVKGPKLHPTHFRRRKNSRRRIGHRQKYLQVTVTKIEG